MPLFVVIAFRDADAVKARVESVLPDGRHYVLTDDSWLADFEGTTKDLAEELGVRSNERAVSTGIVLNVSNYAGRAGPDLWEWMKLHFARQTE